MRPLRRCLAGLACFGLAALGLSADLPVHSPQEASTRVTVGTGWCVIRAVYRIELSSGSQAVQLRVPDTILPETVLVTALRSGITVNRWAIAPCSGAVKAPPPVKFETAGDRMVATFRPGGTAAQAARARQPVLTCHLTADRPGTADLEVTYRAEGMQWRAIYRGRFRPSSAGRGFVSADLSARIHIENSTDMTFEDCVVRLVGPEKQADSSTEKSPGFLKINREISLSLPWLDPVPDVVAESSYMMPGRLTLPRNESIVWPYYTGRRLEARHLYFMPSRFYPDGSLAEGSPVREQVRLTNKKRNKMGLPLPPGQVVMDVSGEGARASFSGYLTHTPIGETAVIDLGQSLDVRGSRRSGETRPGSPGAVEQTYEAHIENGLARPVEVEIEEVSPLSLQWSLVSADAPHQQRGRTLRFTTRVDATSEKTVQYRLKIRRPGLPVPSE